MSKRNRKNASNAAAGDGGTVTQVDGNAVGVAPEGTAATATDEGVDDEILALLGDENAETPPAAVSDPEPVDETATDETAVETVDAEIEVEIEPGDEEAILAELEGEEDAAAVVTATTDTAAPKAKREPKAPAVKTREFTDVAAIDPATLKTNLAGVAAKKVNEKIANMIAAVETGKKLSGYTKTAVATLVKDGKVSGKSLVEAFQAANLTIGTARAQSQQMTALFKATGLVAPDASNAKELVLIDAPLATELMQLAA